MNNNPFADAGKIITGRRFVGRKKVIREVEQYVLGEVLGNLSIVGMPRVGKTSLVWNTIMVKENELHIRNIIPVFIQCKNYQSDSEILEFLINDICQTLATKFENFNVKPLTKIQNEIKKSNTILEKRKKITNFLTTLKILNIKTICILDDFDHTRTIFTTASFIFLRECASSLKTGLSLVTISHRTIYEIEKYVEKNNDPTTTPYLFNVLLNTIFLGMFDEDDLAEYWSRFFGDKINKSNTDKIYRTTGNHPFILDSFNFKLWNEINNDKTASDAIEHVNNVINFSTLYEHLVTFLKDENLYDKLIEIVALSAENIEKVDIQKMKNYGLIKPVDDKFISFSEDFTYYLQNLKVNKIHDQTVYSNDPELIPDLQNKKQNNMNKNYVIIIVISILALIYLINKMFDSPRKSKFEAGKDKIVVEVDEDKPANTSNEKDVKTVTIIGTIKINGINATSEDVKKISMPRNSLVAPVLLTGNFFQLENVPVPKNNLVVIGIELKNGITKSASFNLPSPDNNGISDLKEILIEVIKPAQKVKAGGTTNSSNIIINNNNIQIEKPN